VVCMQTSSQYPRLVTPVRLVKHLIRSRVRSRNVNNNNNLPHTPMDGYG
jgi:hypothetical protein